MPEPTRKELEREAKKAGVPNPEELPNKEALAEAIEQPNPALVPPPEPEPDPAEAAAQPEPEPAPDERAYQVVGRQHAVFGHAPGSKFAAAIPPDQEALLIESGHIKRI